jgi:2-iminobutanoate/2-iminopropanoate deaminase
MVWTAGQCGYLPDKQLVDGLEGQMHQAFKNLFQALESGGCTSDDVVAVNVYLADGDDFDAMNTVYREYFQEPYPVRTTITAGLRPGVLFEISAQAVAR